MKNADALWGRNCEEKFFIKSLEITAAEKLFFNVNKRLIAYWPKSYEGELRHYRVEMHILEISLKNG
ncbi:hypothetical protein AGMMS49921_09250 [Endomicrobiia bacterium]|nr:hypothetical protein AGMMS49921_09250 [Endomicrobiia bacterium]